MLGGESVTILFVQSELNSILWHVGNDASFVVVFFDSHNKTWCRTYVVIVSGVCAACGLHTTDYFMFSPLT